MDPGLTPAKESDQLCAFWDTLASSWNPMQTQISELQILQTYAEHVAGQIQIELHWEIQKYGTRAQIHENIRILVVQSYKNGQVR